MSKDLIPFDFEGKQVRTVVIDAEPWWVGKDVCEVLGYKDPTTAIRAHCKGVLKRHTLTTVGGPQQIRIITEGDVLRLIVSSKLPAAQRFERWVFEEVLPRIRRTDAYAVATPAPSAVMELRGILAEAVSSFRVIASEAQHLRRENSLHRENERLRTALARKGSPLSDDERETIAALVAVGKRPAVIARAMNRSEATIRRFAREAAR